MPYGHLSYWKLITCTRVLGQGTLLKHLIGNATIIRRIEISLLENKQVKTMNPIIYHQL